MQKSWRSACLDVWKCKHVNPETLHSVFLVMEEFRITSPRLMKNEIEHYTTKMTLRGRNTESHHCQLKAEECIMLVNRRLKKDN